MNDDSDFITNPLAIYGSLYFTMAYEGEPSMSSKHFHKIGKFLINRAYIDDENLKHQSREYVTNYCNTNNL